MNQLWSAESSAIKVRFTRSPRWIVTFGPGVVFVALVNPQPRPASPWSVRFTGGRALSKPVAGARALAATDSDEEDRDGHECRTVYLVAGHSAPVSFLQLTTFRVAVIV